MRIKRLIWILILAVVVVYVVTSPETATASAADFGAWAAREATTISDAVIGLLGRFL